MGPAHFSEIVDVFLRLLERGRSVADAAYEVGFNPQTAYRWRDASVDNADRISAAKAKFKAKLIESVLTCAEGDELKEREPDGALALRTLQVIGGEDWRPKSEVGVSAKPSFVDFWKDQQAKEKSGTPQKSDDIRD